jgi:hypothetical protein
MDQPSAPPVAAIARGQKLTPAMLDALRPHVINLSDGRLSNAGRYKTTVGDVEEIFAHHLPQAMEAARKRGEPLRIVVWAHGGLIDEESGLAIAHLQVDWWKQNYVYPIHFVWETGLLDALKQLLSGARELDRVSRDLADHTTDPLVEAAARTVGAGKIWGAMKRTAERASQDDGGAHLVAQRLKTFCDAHADVQLHAVGHSAGSIFHAHFLPMAIKAGVPCFETLQLLAPAMTTTLFKQRFLGAAGSAYKQLRMYTMSRGYEQDDDVARVYRKSLLYLIYHALESDPRTDILGLEISLRNDPDLMQFFGLSGPRNGHAALWSVSTDATGPSATRSTTHGGFDNDRATMDSLVWSIRGEPRVTFPQEEARGLAAGARAFATPIGGRDTGAVTAPLVGVAPGKRRALCIGIDEYAGDDRLFGCVADAVSWQKALEARDFEVTALHDDQATHERVLQEMEKLLRTAGAGDSVVFQYAGHGTQVSDVDGDEDDGDDEALVPYDYASGRFLIDDELFELFGQLGAGASLTCFMDCCHSHTNTRKFLGPRLATTRAAGAADDRVRARSIRVLGTALDEKHRDFRTGSGSRGRGKRTSEEMRAVSFAACEANEKAFESAGQGDFTRIATALLRSSTAVSHDAFLQQVLQQFGDRRRQTPRLDAPVSLRGGTLFGGDASVTGGGADGRDLPTLASRLRDIAGALEMGG